MAFFICIFGFYTKEYASARSQHEVYLFSTKHHGHLLEAATDGLLQMLSNRSTPLNPCCPCTVETAIICNNDMLRLRSALRFNLLCTLLIQPHFYSRILFGCTGRLLPGKPSDSSCCVSRSCRRHHLYPFGLPAQRARLALHDQPASALSRCLASYLSTRVRGRRRPARASCAEGAEILTALFALFLRKRVRGCGPCLWTQCGGR